MATVTSMTSTAIEAALAAKADLAGGILPDAQAPAIAVKKDTWLINIMDHGGHGDGVTADDGAFISALAAINPTWGGKLYLPPGKYLLNGSAAIALTVQGTTIEGAGPEASTIVIGSGFTGPEAISITGKTCRVAKLSIAGASTTTTSNPVCGGVQSVGVRRTRIEDVLFWNINGWAIENKASSSSSGNQDGSIIDYAVIRQCAGGIHFLGNTATGYAVNSMISNTQISQGGVTTGASANLDGVLIEDSWDVLITNLMAWTTTGTGASLHVKGNCAATFLKNFDGLGPNTGNCILIEDGTNGSPQNVQINGGVVQQGLIGCRITGGAYKVNLRGLRFINNQTHGLSVEGTGVPITGRNLTFETSGAGASGTNYDINWSGTATGYLDYIRFETPIVSTGTAGVQKTVNIASAGQNVRCTNMSFNGTGSSSSTWFTNTPSSVFEYSSGTFDFFTTSKFSSGLTAQGNISAQPSSFGNTVFSANTNGSSSFDSMRITSDGTTAAGTGSAARDTTWGRQGVAEFGTAESDIAVMLAGKTLKIKEGTNAKMGTATLNGTTAVTISTTAVTASSRIFLTIQTGAGTVGSPYVSARTAGTSFQVKSTTAGDTSTIAWVILEPA